MSSTDNESSRNFIVGLVAGIAIGCVAGGGLVALLNSPSTIYVPVAADNSTELAASPNAGVQLLANAIQGRVVSITDADTLIVLDESNTQHKIRLEGIDAPESHQAFGTKATNALAGLAFNRAVRVEWAERDKYGRILGHVYADDRWINKAMVQNGWAWHYVEYSDDEELAAAERSARFAKAGLWRDAHPVAPWDFRHNPELAETALASDSGAPRASGVDLRQLGAMPLAPESAAPRAWWEDYPVAPNSAAPTTDTVYITNSGGKYHRGSCRYLAKSRIPIALDDAAGGYTPCSVCNPPTSSRPAAASNLTTPAAPKPETKTVTVYATRTGGKYHRAGCRYLRSSIPMSLEWAKARYSPCSVCNPPY